jgi:hypothetical protein
LESKEGPLTASQRQRGMYSQPGVRDVGVDPDWDLKEGKWNGWERKMSRRYGASPEMGDLSTKSQSSADEKPDGTN